MRWLRATYPTNGRQAGDGKPGDEPATKGGALQTRIWIGTASQVCEDSNNGGDAPQARAAYTTADAHKRQSMNFTCTE